MVNSSPVKRRGTKAILGAVGGAVAALAALVIVVLVVAWATAIAPTGIGDSQLRPSEMRAVMGSGGANNNAFRIDSLSESNQAMAILQAVPPRASDARYVEYRLDGVPRNLEIFLAWRRKDRGGAASFTRLPYADERPAVVRVSDHPDWGGEIEELALYFAPAPQLSARISAFKGLTIEALSLRDASLATNLRSHWTRWSSFRPWSIMSVSSLGYNKDGDVIEGISLQIVVGLALLVTLLVLKLVARGRGVLRAAVGGGSTGSCADV